MADPLFFVLAQQDTKITGGVDLPALRGKSIEWRGGRGFLALPTLTAIVTVEDLAVEPGDVAVVAIREQRRKRVELAR